MISIPTILRSVVSSIDDVYFVFGHHLYISNYLTSKAKANADSFPIVALILDVEQSMYPENLSLESTANFNLILANSTNRNWTPEQRETNNFKGVLYPLYENLLNEMYKSFYFNIQNKNIPHDRTDMYFYDSEDGRNKWNRYVDAIELRFRNLEINKQTNC